jgi:hypothetical protein
LLKVVNLCLAAANRNGLSLGLEWPEGLSSGHDYGLAIEQRCNSAASFEQFKPQQAVAEGWRSF